MAKVLLSIIGSILLLAGCAHGVALVAPHAAIIGTSLLLESSKPTVEKVPLPNGETGYVIDQCNDIADCYQAAGNACGGGKYEIIDRSMREVGSRKSPRTQYSLTVQCK